MKKQRHALMLAAFVLGLCLVAAPALANEFHIINNADETVQISCSTPAGSGTGQAAVGSNMSAETPVNNGSTLDVTCNGTLVVNSYGAQRTSSFGCSSNQVQHVTLTTPEEGGLNLAETCQAAESESSLESS